MPVERLQKIIAAAGIASRRKAEELIQAGEVSVNGTVITELGSKADAESDSIRVNGKLLTGAERREYIALNKPRGYVTTVSDPEGRPTVMELIRSKARVYPIGRLDFNSEGLLLLTNDGDLAHKLMKAASHIPKTYLVKVAGQPVPEQLRRLRAGVSISEERDPKRRVRTAPAQIRVIKEADNPWLEVVLHEGRNRQIRKMFEEIGHHAEKIRRVRYGPLELDLPPGESRLLTPQEVSRLKYAISAQPERVPKAVDLRRERPSGRTERQSSRPEPAGRTPAKRPFGSGSNQGDDRRGPKRDSKRGFGSAKRTPDRSFRKRGDSGRTRRG
jgi:23S rRNA pseudouridine2605 synthase